MAAIIGGMRNALVGLAAAAVVASANVPGVLPAAQPLYDRQERDFASVLREQGEKQESGVDALHGIKEMVETRERIEHETSYVNPVTTSQQDRKPHR